MIYVIMLEPVTPGNVGAVARVMKNFAFDRLVLINPQCDHLCDEARRRAKHSQDILEKAEVCDFFIVDDYDYLVATTARLGTDYNISRSPLLPEELAAKLKQLDPSKKIGLVIGREGHGMFNEEIAKCDFVVTIPSTPQYSTLNISHAVAVILYELHKAFAERHVASHITPIGGQEKNQIQRMFNEIFNSMQWETPEKKQTQHTLWKKIIGKAMLTKREAYGVMGFLRKVLSMRPEPSGAKARSAPAAKTEAAARTLPVQAPAAQAKEAQAVQRQKSTARRKPSAGSKPGKPKATKATKPAAAPKSDRRKKL